MPPITVNWSDLEIAFERNSPDQESFLDLENGDLLSIVEGEPDAAARRAKVANNPHRYLRVDPASSREQYRWMERFVSSVSEPTLRERLLVAIDGKGAFRRFKDVLMAYGPERERWFSFRSERLRIFMEAWLSAHALNPVARPVWVPEPAPKEGEKEVQPREEQRPERRGKSVDTLRKNLRDIADALGPRDLDTLTAFAEFLKARRAARGFAHHSHDVHEGDDQPPASQEHPTTEGRSDSA